MSFTKEVYWSVLTSSVLNLDQLPRPCTASSSNPSRLDRTGIPIPLGSRGTSGPPDYSPRDQKGTATVSVRDRTGVEVQLSFPGHASSFLLRPPDDPWVGR